MSPLRSRRLAPQIALVACTVLAAALAAKVEIQWQFDQARRQGEQVAQARRVAEGLAAHLPGGVVDAAAERLLRDPVGSTWGEVAAIHLVDRRGVVAWSSRDERVGEVVAPVPLPAGEESATGWVGWARGHGAWAVLRDDGARLEAIAPLAGAAVGPGPRVLVVEWDLSRDRAARAGRHLSFHLSGLLFALLVGLVLWWAMRRLLSEPIEELARAAARPDFIARDFARQVGRGDEIGALARAMVEARDRIDVARRDAAERAARLTAAIDATADGVVLATLRDGQWIVDHVNARFASMCGRPPGALEGRTVLEGLDSFAERVVDSDSVRAWNEQALADPRYEGTKPGALRTPTTDGQVLLVDVTTRPVRDEHGVPFGRLWVVRDVTRERTHERRLERKNQEMAAIDLVGRRVSRSLDRGSILQRAVDTLREVTNVPWALLVPGEAGDPAAGSGEEGLRAALAGDLPALAAGAVVSIPEAAARPALVAAVPAGTGSLVLLPLRDSTGLVAVLVLGRPGGDAFAAEEIGLLHRLVRPVDAALENARLFARSEAQLAENQTLTEVGRSIGRGDSLEAVLEDILRVIHERLHYRNAAILLPDDPGEVLYVRASVGYHVNLGSIRLPVDGASVTARAFRTGVPLNVPDVALEPGYVAGSDDIRSELAIPLVIGGRVLGVLDVESDRLAAFGPDDERLLGSVAGQAAMVLQNARLLVETRARATRFEAVNEIARSVASTLDPHHLDRAIVSQIARVVPCERYAMLHYDHETRRVKRTVVLDPRAELAHEGDGLSWSFDEGLDPATLGAHRAESFPDLAAIADRAEVRHVAHGLSSLVLVPIVLDGAVAAAIVAASARSHGFSSEQIRLLEAVSFHVGVALKNARLFDRLQVSYRQLDEAQDGLVRSEKLRALGEMASGVAHDFNNVLGAILGRAQLLKLAVGPGEIADELDIIEKAAHDGASTVRRLQDFTRVRTDRGFRPVDLVQVVGDSLSLTRGRWRDEAERAGIHYEVVSALAPVPPVAGEASELREVVTNLIINALDAMPGGGALRFESHLDPAGQEVHLDIGDTGEGMSEEVRTRIFDPFFTTKGVRGVGLGLSVVYGIVKRHGGRIQVRSEPGKGTTMRLSLPACVAAGADGGTADAAPLEGGFPLAPRLVSGPALRVLVVDDEPGVRSLLADLLRAGGHEVSEAASGREALALLPAATDPARPGFDLVLTDLGMPDMSGWDVARAIGERADAPPVVLVTGWGIQLDDTLLAASGVSDVIAKPFTVEEVLAVVDRAGRRAARAGPPAARRQLPAWQARVHPAHSQATPGGRGEFPRGGTSRAPRFSRLWSARA